MKQTILSSSIAFLLTLPLTISAQSPSSTAPITLPETTINGYQPDAYTVPDATGATKTDTPIMQTPVSVQVIPQQVLRDEQIIHLDDALQNVSGVIPTNDSYGTGDSFALRGFDSAEVTYEDGVKLDQYTVAGLPLDLANIERIEVVKGPASVLYGQAEPGGLVNIVVKKPQDTFHFSLEQDFGTFDLYRTVLDMTGPLNSSKTLLYRVVVDYQNFGSFRDFVYSKRTSAYPSLEWKPTPNDKIIAEYRYNQGTEVLDNGIPFQANGKPANVTSARNFVDPNTNASPSTEDIFKLTAEHKFTEDLKLRLVYKTEYIDNPTANQQVYTGDVDSFGNLQRFGFTESVFKHRTDQIVLDVTAKFETFGVKHTMIAGFDYYHLDGRYDGNTYNPPAINIFDPIYNQPYQLPNSKSDFYVHQLENAYGAYFQEQMELPGHVHLMGGFRYDNEISSDTGFGNAAERVHDTPPPKPRVGLLWQPIPQVSLYGSYTENYGDTALGSLTPNGTILPPESAKQYEAGIKTELFDKKLTATASVYQITKENIPAADPINPLYTIAIGEARSRGFEFDLAGEIRPGWKIIASYSYIDCITTRDTNFPSMQGFRFPGIPYNSGSIWTTYEFKDGFWKGLKLGAGVVCRGPEVAYDEEPPYTNFIKDRVGGYALVNAIASYTWNVGTTKMTAQLNMNNILDTAYFVNATPSQALPGQPFNILGSLRFEF